MRGIRQWESTAAATLFRNRKIKIQSIHKGTGLNQKEKIAGAEECVSKPVGWEALKLRDSLFFW